MHQQIEHLRLDRNQFTTATQLAALGVQHMFGKKKSHASIPEIGSARPAPQLI
jgi:hypothetical protein